MGQEECYGCVSSEVFVIKFCDHQLVSKDKKFPKKEPKTSQKMRYKQGRQKRTLQKKLLQKKIRKG